MHIYGSSHFRNIFKETVYNSIGEKLVDLVNEYKAADSYDIEFNAAHLTSGVYIYRLESGNFIQTRRMLLLK